MVEAKKYYGLSISVVSILIFISVICVVIGCSPKKDKKDKPGAEKTYPARADVNVPSAGKVSHLPKSPILPLPDANQAAKRGKGVSANTLRKEYNKADSSKRKIEVLQFLPDGAIDRDPCAIELAEVAVADADGNVALAGVELVQGSERPAVLPVVVKAMSHPDEEVRRMAVGTLSDIDTPRTADLLITALSDESKDVRNAALDVARDKDEKVQFKVLEKGISSSYADVKEESVSMLEQAGGHRAVDILIEALQDKDAKFRQEVASALSMLIDEEFTSYEEAKIWWGKNKNKYDEDLSLK